MKKGRNQQLTIYGPALEHLKVILVRDGCTDKIRAPRLV